MFHVQFVLVVDHDGVPHIGITRGLERGRIPLAGLRVGTAAGGQLDFEPLFQAGAQGIGGWGALLPERRAIGHHGDPTAGP